MQQDGTTIITQHNFQVSVLHSIAKPDCVLSMLSPSAATTHHFDHALQTQRWQRAARMTAKLYNKYICSTLGKIVYYSLRCSTASRFTHTATYRTAHACDAVRLRSSPAAREPTPSTRLSYYPIGLACTGACSHPRHGSLPLL